MINVITDLIQSFSIIMLATMAFLLVRRVHALNKRLDQNSIAVAQVRETSETQPVCGCGHHQCFHDETSCGKTDILVRYNGDEYEKSPVQCGCKRYTGPEQLPTVIP